MQGVYSTKCPVYFAYTNGSDVNIVPTTKRQKMHLIDKIAFSL